MLSTSRVDRRSRRRAYNADYSYRQKLPSRPAVRYYGYNYDYRHSPVEDDYSPLEEYDHPYGAYPRPRGARAEQFRQLRHPRYLDDDDYVYGVEDMLSDYERPVGYSRAHRGLYRAPTAGGRLSTNRGRWPRRPAYDYHYEPEPRTGSKFYSDQSDQHENYLYGQDYYDKVPPTHEAARGRGLTRRQQTLRRPSRGDDNRPTCVQ